MDLVKLSKQPIEVQMEVAKILESTPTTTFRQAFVTAKLRLIPDAWSADNRKLREEILPPRSIMKFEREKNKLNDICEKNYMNIHSKTLYEHILYGKKNFNIG